jgi:uncharacterized protein YlzI (FlbEa/FlbD family)
MFAAQTALLQLQRYSMRWVTLTAVDGTEHVFNLQHVVQVVTQNGTTSRQVQLVNGEKILVSEQDWFKKLQQEIQRSRNV